MLQLGRRSAGFPAIRSSIDLHALSSVRIKGETIAHRVLTDWPAADAAEGTRLWRAVEGEICLQPILRAGLDYLRACGDEWVKLFADPRNRIEAWRS